MQRRWRVELPAVLPLPQSLEETRFPEERSPDSPISSSLHEHCRERRKIMSGITGARVSMMKAAAGYSGHTRCRRRWPPNAGPNRSAAWPDLEPPQSLGSRPVRRPNSGLWRTAPAAPHMLLRSDLHPRLSTPRRRAVPVRPRLLRVQHSEPADGQLWSHDSSPRRNPHSKLWAS